MKKIIKPLLSSLVIAWMCMGCDGTQDPENSVDSSDSSEVSDAADASDAADMSDASDTGDDQPMAGFTLVDENDGSATYEQEISLSDYEGEVSAWYFLHCT